MRKVFYLFFILSALGINAGEINIISELYTNSPVNLYYQANNIFFEKYMAEHKNVKIKPFTSLRAVGTAARSGKLMAAAANNAPDIWRLLFHEGLKYSEQGLLIPLNKYIYDKDGNVKYQRWNTISPEVKAACMVGDQIYSIPVETAIVQALCYRIDLFRQAGLNSNKPPLNWDELWYYARKLTFKPYEEKNKPFGQSGLYFANTSYLGFTPVLWSAGGELMKKYVVDPETKQKVLRNLEEEFPSELRKEKVFFEVAFNSEAGIDALNFMHKLRWQKWSKDPRNKEPFDLTPEQLNAGVAIAPSGAKIELNNDTVYEGVLYFGSGNAEDANISKQFANGRIAMIFTYSHFSANLITNFGMSPDQIGYGPMPVKPGCQIVGSDMPFMLGIASKKGRSTECEAAAWDIIKGYASEEQIIARTKMLVEGGAGNTVAPRFLKLAGYHELYNSFPEIWRNWDSLIKKNRTEPFVNGWSEIQAEIMSSIVSRVWSNENIDNKLLLEQAERDANNKLSGWDEHVLKSYRPIAWGIWILVFCGFLFAMYFIITNMSSKVKSKNNDGKSTVGNYKKYYILLLAVPAILSILIWKYYPLLRGSVMGFQNYKITGESQWVGIDNFIMIFGDVNFYLSMMRTCYYVVLTLGIGFVIPIVLAILLTEIPRGKVLLRTIFYLPSVTSGVVIMLLWMRFYEPTPAGFLNQIVITVASWFGIITEGFKWLNDPKLAMLCVIIPGVWASAGAGSLIYQAALTSVPHDLYEAADVDGAGFFKKITNITIPTLKPLIIINFVGAFIGAFHAMGNIFIMTGGGPFNSTRVIGLDIWYNAFIYLKFGMATAMAWVLGMLLIGFTVMQLRILSKVEFNKAKGN